MKILFLTFDVLLLHQCNPFLSSYFVFTRLFPRAFLCTVEWLFTFFNFLTFCLTAHCFYDFHLSVSIFFLFLKWVTWLLLLLLLSHSFFKDDSWCASLFDKVIFLFLTEAIDYLRKSSIVKLKRCHQFTLDTDNSNISCIPFS